MIIVRLAQLAIKLFVFHALLEVYLTQEDVLQTIVVTLLNHVKLVVMDLPFKAAHVSSAYILI